MAKTKRGKALWNTPSTGRGTCPICKLHYIATNSGGKPLTVCKKCSSVSTKSVDKAMLTRNIGFRRKFRRELNVSNKMCKTH